MSEGKDDTKTYGWNTSPYSEKKRRAQSVFDRHWENVHQPLAGNKKGYKKGYEDGFNYQQSKIQKLKQQLKEAEKVLTKIKNGTCCNLCKCHSCDAAEYFHGKGNWRNEIGIDGEIQKLTADNKKLVEALEEISSRAAYLHLNLPKVKFEDLNNGAGLTGPIWEDAGERVAAIIKCSSKVLAELKESE